MQIYIHERSDETTLVLSEEGRILSVHASADEAWDNIYNYANQHELLVATLEDSCRN